MTRHHAPRQLASFGLLAALMAATWAVAPSVAAHAQAPASASPQGRGAGPQPAQPPAFVSPEVLADRRVTFRIFAPDAQQVTVRSPGDAGGRFTPAQLTKQQPNGVWEATYGPMPAGAYRYAFTVNGVTVVDTKNPLTSQTNTTVYSLAVVPGSDAFDTKNVPHGAVASVYYDSTALGGIRRMHVYTPPGYEAGRDRYPVFYLLHGAGDVDDSWSSVGRAGFIIDNLIAAGKAKPMIVVMPAGHVFGAGQALGGAVPAAGATPDPFLNDFTTDIVPFVEKHYRVLTDRGSRAIAGLSMGGSQTLNIAFAHLDRYGYVGVFSSGILGGAGRGATANAPFGAAWEKENAAALDNAVAKKGLSLLWFSTGKDDMLISTTRSTVELLKQHGFRPVFIESEGAHTWLNWRDYLAAFAPQLFQGK